MATHRLDPAPETTVNVYSPGHAPVLYLPVAVPGALLYLGDGHGAQGDGEACGTAIECGMTTEADVKLAAARPLASIHAEWGVHAVLPAGLLS